jgi:hypothetical protein
LIVLVSFASASSVFDAVQERLSPVRRWTAIIVWCGLLVLLHFPRDEWQKNIRYKARLERGNIAIGRYFASIARPDDLLCTEVIGAIGYYSDLPILDVHGLVDYHIARQPFGTGIRKIGHQKADLDYILARAPRFIYAHDYIRSLDQGQRARIRARYRPARKAITSKDGEEFGLPYFEQRHSS